MKTTILSLCTLLTATGLTSAARADHHGPDKAPVIGEAVCVIAPSPASDGKVKGLIVLKQEKDAVHLTGEVSGLTPGKHGFHIHKFGDLRNPEGLSLGPHYNPEDKPHGGPHTKERHAGDLGNIEADAKGVAKVDAKAEGVSLHHILGRSIVVHADADDLKSQPAGDAGPRIGYGVIGIAEVKAPSAN